MLFIIRKTKMKKLLILSIAILGFAFGQEKFKTYGFMDLQFSQWYNVDDTELVGFFVDREPKLAMGNVNLYFDMNPNDRTRALIEVALNESTFDDAKESNTVLANATFGGLSATQVRTIDYLPGFDDQFSAIPDSATRVATIAAAREQLATQLENSVFSTEGSDGKKYGGIEIPRAWMEYYVNDLVRLRAGKFITPAGIWAVDHGSPIITTVSQPNQTDFFPLFPTTQTGLMILGNMFLGDDELNYYAYISAGRQDDSELAVNTEKFSDFGFGYKLSYKTEEKGLDYIEVGHSFYTGVIRTMTKVMTITDYDVVTGAGINSWSYQNDLSVREYAAGGDIKLSHAGVNFQSEVNYRKIENEVSLGVSADKVGKSIEYLGFYFLLSYDHYLSQNIKVSPYAMFERIEWYNPENAEWSFLSRFSMDGWDTYLAGLNFNFYSNYVFKVEYSYANVSASDPTVIPNNYSGDDLNLSAFSSQISVAF